MFLYAILFYFFIKTFVVFNGVWQNKKCFYASKPVHSGLFFRLPNKEAEKLMIF